MLKSCRFLPRDGARIALEISPPAGRFCTWCRLKDHHRFYLQFNFEFFKSNRSCVDVPCPIVNAIYWQKSSPFKFRPICDQMHARNCERICFDLCWIRWQVIRPEDTTHVPQTVGPWLRRDRSIKLTDRPTRPADRLPLKSSEKIQKYANEVAKNNFEI